MKIEQLDKITILNEEVFDYLFSIKDVIERDIKFLELEEKAQELRVKTKFLKVYQQFEREKTGTSSVSITQFLTNPFMQLNCGEWTADGYGVRKKDSRGAIKYASSIPILPVGIICNLDEQTEKIKLAFLKRKWETIVCERSTVANSNKIIELANKGVEVNSSNSKYLVKYLADCISKNLFILPCSKAVSRLGWINDEFVPYCDNLCFDGKSENEHIFNAITEKGHYPTWINETKKLRENIYLRLMMNASFASPLIEVLGGLPFVFHLWGGTEAGKTVALMVAMSIWGDPSLGKLVKTMNMTVNSMMSTCGFLQHIPFAGDELQTIKSKYISYDSIIMKVCEGIDRARMKYDSLVKTKTWKNTILFTGEEPCTKNSSGGGTKNRVIEVEVDGKVVENGNSTANFVRENFGFAGRAFIDIIRKTDNLKERLNEIYLEILDTCNTTDKQALSMAFILLADELVSEHIYSVNPLTPEQIKPFVKTKKEVDTATRAYEFVVNLVARHNMRFAGLDQNYGEVWGKREDDFVLINKDVLISKLAEYDFDFDAVKKKWAEKGLLIKNSQGRFVHNTHCFGTKGIYVKIQIDVESESEKTNGSFKNFEDFPF